MPARPWNEDDRLAALHSLEILDTAPEETFDRITRLAASLLGVPMVLVSFVGAERQWSKSTVGMEPGSTPRELAFCAHAILSAEIMVVPDATKDPRFHDNPLVTGPPRIRFYAGAPLEVRDGVRVGTLCIIDDTPRALSDGQRAMLRDLAAVAIDELALRARVKELREAKAGLDRQARELVQANEALSQFAHMAAHDLRGPLKTIINMADIALLEQPSPPVTFIREAALRLEEVVSGYQRLARLRLGAQERLSLVALLDDAGGALRVEPSGLAGQAVFGDRVLLRQVFANLAQNAVRYGSGAVLRVSAADADGWTVVRVQNPVAEAVPVDQSVFAPFRTLHTDGRGTGLGLAIVERIVQLHGGQVSASCSAEDFTVSLRLPRAPSGGTC